MKYLTHFCLAVVLTFAVGCNKSQGEAATPNKNPTAPMARNDQSGSNQRVDSRLLTDEFVGAIVEQMLITNPDEDAAKLRADVEKTIETAKAERRKASPGYLMLTAADEKLLQAGKSLPDVGERIANAEKSLDKRWLDSGLIKVWLPKHKAGTLTPVQTEVLAHVMEATSKSAK